MGDFRREPVLESVEVVIFQDGQKIVIRDVMVYSLGDGDIEILACELERIDSVLKECDVLTT